MGSGGHIRSGVCTLFCITLAAAVLCGCGDKRRRGDTTTSGVAMFVCDENFEPVVGRQADVFEALNREATLLPVYTDEAGAMSLLLSDSVRLAVVARDFTEGEVAQLKLANRELVPRSQKIASDGVAVIVHRTNGDTLMSLRTLAQIMLGEVTRWEQIEGSATEGEIEVVFDSPNSCSARMIRDSVCDGRQLYAGLRALDSNREVLRRVGENPLSLGIIGSAHISHPHDTTHVRFNESVNVVALSREHPATEANCRKPVPAYIHLREYPLWRDVYVLLTDMRGTLPSGFTHFMATESGQRIALKAGVVPATMPLRTIVTRDNL